jgi:hypothetical protein
MKRLSHLLASKAINPFHPNYQSYKMRAKTKNAWVNGQELLNFAVETRAFDRKKKKMRKRTKILANRLNIFSVVFA